MSDEYLNLVEGARDALHDLLMASEPDSGFGLRRAYHQLKTELEKSKPGSHSTAGSDHRTPSTWTEEREHVEVNWRNLPRPEKLHLVRNALGDQALTLRELTEKLELALQASAGPMRHASYVFQSSLVGLVKELVEMGEWGRTKEDRTPGSPQYRWRYHRLSKLSPEMESLRDALGEEQS